MKTMWHLLQTFDQFEYDGCENCEEYLHLKKNRDAVYECTSSSFDGYGRRVDMLQIYFITLLTSWLPGFAWIPNLHPLHNCHHIKLYPPPVKQYIMMHRNSKRDPPFLSPSLIPPTLPCSLPPGLFFQPPHTP